MTGKSTLVAAVAILLAGTGSGCVSCCHQVCKPVLEAGPECDLPIGNRQRAYAVFVNGLTPDCGTGLTGLRDKLAEQGFPKVYYGQLCHAIWLAQEMRRVHKDDPDARFVVVGYDLGCPVATKIASDAAADGLAVDALVLLDPTGTPDRVGSKVRTVVARSGPAVVPVPHTESVSVPGAGHFGLPTHPLTVNLLGELMAESAGRVPTPAPMPSVQWSYEFAPPEMTIPVPGPDADPAWNFLLDVPGPRTAPLPAPNAPPVVIPPAASPPTPKEISRLPARRP